MSIVCNRDCLNLCGNFPGIFKILRMMRGLNIATMRVLAAPVSIVCVMEYCVNQYIGNMSECLVGTRIANCVLVFVHPEICIAPFS